MLKTAPLIIVLTINLASAQTMLSGNIGGNTFKPSGNPYIIQKSIEISGNKTTVVKPGCIFLFYPFTELNVKGPLIVTGTADTPVVFTSINDVQYNQASATLPNEFDWNGIVVSSTAGEVKLTDFHIVYSVFGIKSNKQDIVVERGIFRNNGQYHFTINDKVVAVNDNLPCNYGRVKDMQLRPKPAWIRPVGIAAVATGTVVLGVTGYFYYNVNKYEEKYNNGTRPVDIEHYKNRHRKYKQYTITGAITGGILLPAGIGFLLWNPGPSSNPDKITLHPILGETNGIFVGFTF
jgi:hypothetical protein